MKDIHDVIKQAKFGDDRLKGSGVVAGQISAFPIDFAGRPYNTLTLPCERVITLGPLNTSACQLFGNLGRKISSSSGDDREGAFLFQRVSMLVQRFNSVLLHDSLPTPDCTD